MRRTGLALLFCCWATVTYAQPELSITVRLRNPAPYALEQWRSDPTIVQVTISNPTSSPKRFVLDLYLQNQNTRQEVQTNEMHPCMPVFELAPGQTRTLNGPELICEPSLVYDATIRTQLITTGAIPEGEYRFCVRALDADNRSRELTSSGTLCASTQVQWYDPPAIVRPVARDRGLRCDQAIVLNWQPPTPVPAPGSVVYRVRVVGMFEGQLPRQALEAATSSETVVDAEVSTTSYTIGANDPVILDLLRRPAPRCIGFAWQVQALQATTRRPFPTRGGTQGKSTIETFTVECPGSTANMPKARTPEQQLEQAHQTFRSTVASEMQAAARQAGVKIRTDNFVAIPFDDSGTVVVNAMIEGADRLSIEELAKGADVLFVYSGAKLGRGIVRLVPKLITDIQVGIQAAFLQQVESISREIEMLRALPEERLAEYLVPHEEAISELRRLFPPSEGTETQSRISAGAPYRPAVPEKGQEEDPPIKRLTGYEIKPEDVREGRITPEGEKRIIEHLRMKIAKERLEAVKEVYRRGVPDYGETLDPDFYVVRISQNPASGQWLAQFKNLQGRIVLETDALVAATLRQMEAYSELVAATAKTLQEYVAENKQLVSGEEVWDWLVKNLPGPAASVAANPTPEDATLVRKDVALLDDEVQKIRQKVDLGQTWSPSGDQGSLTIDGTPKTTKKLTKNDVNTITAKVRERGIIRLVVDYGEIETRLTFTTYGESLAQIGEHDPFKNITLSVSSKSCPSCAGLRFVSQSRTLREAAWQLVKKVAKEPVSIEQVVPVSLGPVPLPDAITVLFNCGTENKPDWCECTLVERGSDYAIWSCIGQKSKKLYVFVLSTSRWPEE